MLFLACCQTFDTLIPADLNTCGIHHVRVKTSKTIKSCNNLCDSAVISSKESLLQAFYPINAY